jgi:hypothetical protein
MGISNECQDGSGAAGSWRPVSVHWVREVELVTIFAKMTTLIRQLVASLCHDLEFI